MKKKKIILLSLIILVVVIVLLVVLWPRNEKITKKEIREYENNTTTNMEKITSSDITLKEMETIVGKDIANIHLTVGENSYLRNRPSDEVIKKYNLEDYVKKQEKLVKQVEERYLKALEYEVIDSQVQKNKVCQTIEISTYYYALYLIDLINLTNEIVDEDLPDVEESIGTEIAYFKGQIAATEILNKHLDDYENKSKEKTSATVCYKNGKVEDEDQMLSLMVAMQGETYSNCDFSKEENQKLANERLAKYIKEYEESL